jgi:hypothetical protein
MDKTFISWRIFHQHWYTCPVPLPVRQNLQHRSGIICDFRMPLREFLDPVVKRFTQQTLPIVNRKHFFINILWIESFCLQKTHNRTLLFGSVHLKHGRHFDYWNQSMNECMRVCYLDCHEAGLCCCLVIHIECLLCPLQLFYFHLWPIYWLSLIALLEFLFVISYFS